MRKIISCMLITALVACFVGCSSQIEEDIGGTESSGASVDIEEKEEPVQINMDFAENRISISEYQNEYSDDINAIKKIDYGKLDFDDCEFVSIDGIETIGIYRLYSESIGAEESIDVIKKWLVNIGQDDIDLEKELRDASGQYEAGDGDYPYNYPAVLNYYPEFDSGTGFFINTKECYIQMGNAGIYSMSDGSITEFLNLDTLAAMDALGVNEENIVDKGMVSEKGSDVWELPGGSVSIKDASETARKFFEAGTPYKNPDGITVDVPEVNVFTLNDKYGYAFTIRRVYKGVPFAYASTGTRTYYSSEYEILEDMKTAYVINNERVAAYTGYIDGEQIEALTDEQTEMISLSSAVTVLDKFLGSQVRQEVSRVSLVYCTVSDEIGNKIAYPCWEFDSLNQTNSQVMRLYVNALSGDVYFYSYVEE